MLRQAFSGTGRSVPNPLDKKESDMDEPTCPVPDPEGHSKSGGLKNGMCGRHYQRLRNGGDPLVKRSRWDGMTPEMRLLAKVDKNGPLPEKRPELGPCWVWGGSKMGSGYGSFYLEGHHVGAHVAAYTLMRKPVPDGAELDHLCHPGDGSCSRATCRHRLCVNPDHLEPVTRAENVRRGSSIFGQNMRKTRCLRGHELTPENTYVKILPDGRESRQCRTCTRLRAGFKGDLDAPAVANGEKTHCPKGHPFDEENTYYPPNGGRMCRICRREQWQAWRDRNNGK